MEASPLAESVLGTTTLAGWESARPRALGSVAVQTCCALVAVVTAAAAPRPDTLPDCASARTGASVRPLTTASAPRPESHRATRRWIVVTVIAPSPPAWFRIGKCIVAQLLFCRWMLPPVRYPKLW